MVFEELAAYRKDLKRLLKRFRTLYRDMEVVRKVLEVSPHARPPFSFRLDGLGIEGCVIKVKKIACRSLHGRGVNSGIRLVYAHFEQEEKIVFIELYHKSDKEKEDRERIEQYFNVVLSQVS